MSKENVGKLDKAIRIVVAFILSGLYITQSLTGVLGILALITGSILIVTAIVGTCPIYKLLGKNTCKVKEKG